MVVATALATLRDHGIDNMQLSYSHCKLPIIGICERVWDRREQFVDGAAWKSAPAATGR